MAGRFELDAPETAAPGSLVVLDASAIPSSGRAWRAVNAPAETYRVVDDAERLVFATSRPGKYYFVFVFTEDVSAAVAELEETQAALLAAITSGAPTPDDLTTAFAAVSDVTRRFVKLKSRPQTLVHVLTIEGDVPDDDDDDGAKPLPNGRFRLAELSRAEAVKLSDNSQAATVAGVYRAVAAQVQAGALEGEQRILDETVRKLNERLGDGFAVWKPWGLVLMNRLSDLYEAGELKTDDDFAAAFGEIALGLEAL